MQVAEITTAPEKARASKFRSYVNSLAVLGALFAFIVLLQWRTGAFRAEFSGYPDEASHYMSGLLVHDYVAARFPAAPMRFARDFYLHYPYLAIGHWPPAFYALEGAWMLVFSPSRVSVMLLMALITSLLALAVYRLVSEEFGTMSAWVMSVVLVLIPLVLQYTSMVMLETVLALLSLGAVIYFGRFLEGGRWQDSAKFAALFAIAMLTKANAADLALAAVLGLLLCRRMALVVRPSFWVPAGVAALICGPWHLATMHLMLPTFTADEGLRFTATALRFFSGTLIHQLGAGFAILAVLGIYHRIILAMKHNRVDAKWAMITSLPLSVVVFHSLVSAGLERRYLITAIPPLLLLSAAGARFLAENVRLGSVNVHWRQQAALLAATLIFAGRCFPLPVKESFGFEQAADRITSDPLMRSSLILVSSETNVGEGILVSEIAMRQHGITKPVILRASKILAENSWNQSLDANYKPLLPDAEAMRQCLEQSAIRLIVLDTSPGPKTYQHHREIVEMLQTHSDQWKLLGSFAADGLPSSRGPVQLYSFTGSDPNTGLDPLRRIHTNLDERLQSWPIIERLNCTANRMETSSGAMR